MDWTLSTVLPVLCLGAAGAVVPILFMRVLPDTLRGLVLACLGSAGVLTVGGALLFVWLYGREGLDLARLGEAPLAAFRHFAGLGLRAAIVWAPVLLLTGIALGQGIEARRGRAMAARDRD